MLSVADARTLMLERVGRLSSEHAKLEHAYGRVLAEPLIATRDQPPFASSAMDGYALASAPAPRDVIVAGESAAGKRFAGKLGPDEAVRISTGAPMPDGADGVLIQEDARLDGARLLAANVTPGRHVRPRGGDFRAGELLLEASRRLDPIAVALAAGAGVSSLTVTRRPRVTVFAGGDELAQPGAQAGPDQIYESGSFAVCGLIDQWGGDAERAAALPDDEDKIVRAVKAPLESCDLIVLIGGASVGPHDHARAALQRLGVDILVPKIAVRPGKPTWFGAAQRGLVLGLPGNAASAVVCAYLFLRPILEAMIGRDALACVRTSSAPLAAALKQNGARETYLRAQLDGDGRLTAFTDQDSSLMSVLARANALIVREPGAAALASGAPADYLPLDA